MADEPAAALPDAPPVGGGGGASQQQPVPLFAVSWVTSDDFAAFFTASEQEVAILRVMTAVLGVLVTAVITCWFASRDTIEHLNATEETEYVPATPINNQTPAPLSILKRMKKAKKK